MNTNVQKAYFAMAQFSNSLDSMDWVIAIAEKNNIESELVKIKNYLVENDVDTFDLKMRAKFVTPFGLKLLGYLVGMGDIYCIAIFAGDKVFYFNRNSPEDYAKDLSEMSKLLGKNLTLANFSPLKYTTDIDLEEFNNIEGEFDLLKKRTNEERLKRFEGKT